MISNGIPVPILQPTIFDADGRQLGRVDFATDDGLIGEFDGKVKYDKYLRPGESAADAVMAEKQRENALRATQRELVRWDWELLRTPENLLERWRIAQQRASQLPPPTGTMRLLPMPKRKIIDWTTGITWAN